MKWSSVWQVVATAVVLTCVSSNAALITVDETGMGASRIVRVSGPNIGTVWTLAGVKHLVVDGVAMDGFCIDPFHPSRSSCSDYQFIDLANGPKESAMGADTAVLLSRLWGSYYSPDMSAETAAGLQIAIWRLTGGSAFSLLSGCDFGAANFLATVQDPNYSGPVASLIGLTGSGQDYVVWKVPDGGSTLALLGFGFCGLYIMGRAKKA